MDGVILEEIDSSQDSVWLIFDDTVTDIDEITGLLSDGGYPVDSVNYINSAPTPDAGEDLMVLVGENVTLDGSASFDPDDDDFTCQWVQVSGAAVELTLLEGSQAVFTAPEIPFEDEILVFSLIAIDSNGLASSEDVEVHVYHTLPFHVDLAAAEAKELIDTQQDLIVMDVREPDEFCGEYGHIPDALNYPWNSGELENNFQEIDENLPVLVVCGSGMRSNNASIFLVERGFREVYDMTGGMAEWTGETEGCQDQAAFSENSGGCFISTCLW